MAFLDDWIFMWLPEKSDQWSKKIMSSLKNVNDAKNVINKFLSVRLQLCKIIPGSWCTFSDTKEYLNHFKDLLQLQRTMWAGYCIWSFE